MFYSHYFQIFIVSLSRFLCSHACHSLLHPLSSSLFKVLSLTMYSFISDFVIGIGGSDFGSSIQQPMVDREVISIGGCSLEETRRGASDSESSSSETLMISHHATGGISHLCKRVQPSATSPD